MPVEFPDCPNAAIAVRMDRPLVTGNTGIFRRSSEPESNWRSRIGGTIKLCKPLRVLACTKAGRLALTVVLIVCGFPKGRLGWFPRKGAYLNLTDAMATSLREVVERRIGPA